ncbi:peroxiredoxin family protein [Winogradskyella psychrotolerans]|uniref:peroxiredoxin family protein n=1 Tax=Winogradskyella psychrotolerans TaxID=1344585 RepID=UPI001C06EFCF|nr:TlpA disulfide reductase family protein [Winogradskyella psychrotolerans]MBU2930158.1 TlpA family protein disulfide reductase [Winogradskyella psychrotolerans]
MRLIITCLLTVLIFSCRNEIKTKNLEVGTYRAWLTMQDNEVLPFIFEVKSSHSLHIYNAEEVIEVDEIEYKNDSVYIKAPVFEGYLVAKISNEETLQGYYVKESLDRVVPFKAEGHLTNRFEVQSKSTKDVSGIWETVFSKDIAGEEYIAKGIFEQEGDRVTGTFRTTTGDYRYLEGVMDGNEMKLSTFDGAHAFLFTAQVTDSTMVGTFYSGNHWKEPFVAKRNESFELPEANDLTFLKDGYDSIEFTFPNTSDELVSLKDDRFKGKVVIVQIMGTWCPNCLDETKYFSEFYKNNNSKRVEFVALAFEYVKTKADAYSNINRLQSRIGIEYPILLAQYGSSDKVKAQEKLPMLNHVLSYPTSIFIDKTGKVRKIHTGFNGPATGDKYEEFKTEFESFVDALLNE